MRLIDRDLMRRIRESFHDEKDGRVGIFKEQDVQPVLEEAAKMRELQEGMRWGDGKHVAHIPVLFVERMMRDPRKFPDDELAGILGPGYKVLDQKRWKAWLNDSANALWRTYKGEI